MGTAFTLVIQTFNCVKAKRNKNSTQTVSDASKIPGLPNTETVSTRNSNTHRRTDACNLGLAIANVFEFGVTFRNIGKQVSWLHWFLHGQLIAILSRTERFTLMIELVSPTWLELLPARLPLYRHLHSIGSSAVIIAASDAIRQTSSLCAVTRD